MFLHLLNKVACRSFACRIAFDVQIRCQKLRNNENRHDCSTVKLLKFSSILAAFRTRIFCFPDISWKLYFLTCKIKLVFKVPFISAHEGLSPALITSTLLTQTGCISFFHSFFTQDAFFCLFVYGASQLNGLHFKNPSISITRKWLTSDIYLIAHN